jgi:glycerol-3-phosphate acyltransferase PlsY
MTTFLLFVIAIISYFLGGINGAIITSKYIFRKDVRNHGSKNAGLTNYYRCFGAPGTALVLAIDILKAVIGVVAGTILLGTVGYPKVGAAFATFCIMLGHDYPAYYGFKGGKGVLCGVAAVCVLSWKVGLACLAAFAVVLIFTRLVSLASMVGALLLPIGIGFSGMGGLAVVLGLFSCILIIFKHTENIKRLISGTESKFSFSPPPAKKFDE